MSVHTWTGGAADGLWATAGNWTGGVPPTVGTVADVIISGSDTISFIGAANNPLHLSSLDMTGFTGTLVHTSSAMVVNVSDGHGSIIIPATAVFNFAGAGANSALDIYVITTSSTLDIAISRPIRALYCVGPSAVELTANLATTTFSAYSGGLIDMGTFDVTISSLAEFPGDCYFDAADLLTWSAGASITYTSGTCYLGSDVGELAEYPPIVVAGADVEFWSGSTIESLTLNSGSIDCSGGGTPIQVGGNVDLNGGTIVLTDSEWTVGGNFDTDNVDLTDGTFDVTGTAEAHDAAITNCDFSAGTALDASDNCTGSGNTNVTGISAGAPASAGFWI